MDDIQQLRGVLANFLLPSSRRAPTFITVAPSLVMVCLPFSSTMSRSPPYGPRVDLMVACTARQALMLEMICPLPCEVSVPAKSALSA